ncbi:response regulator transcription factor [Paenibacillus sp. CAU 1782]
MHTFIIVDDEPLIRKGLLKKIQSFHTPLTFLGEADNGADALLLIKSTDPDIILTDMRMPEMDGKSLMKHIHEQYPDKKIIVISGYSDFEYMQEAISSKVIGYLLKPFSREEIHRMLQLAINAIDQHRSVKLEVVQKEAENEEISLKSDVQSLLNIILGIHQLNSLPAFSSKAFATLAEQDNYMLLTLYSPQPLAMEQPPAVPDSLYIPHPQSANLAFVILTFRRGESERAMLGNAELAAKQLIEQAGAKGGGESCIGVSSVKPSLAALREAHQETIAALDKRSVTDFGKCYIYSPDAHASTVVFWNKSHELLFFIESGNVSKTKELVLDFFAFFMLQPDVTLVQLKEQARDIMMEVKKLLSAYLQTNMISSSSSSFESVLSISFDIDAIKDYMLKVLTGIAELLKERSAYSSDHVIDNIKMYINNHYAEDLTLERVSSLFYLNPSYLSHLFKEKTAENFTDYINKLRIEQAKNLLRSTDDKVYKIAKSIGYDNPKYFFRLFKKVTGTTPENFRNG